MVDKKSVNPMALLENVKDDETVWVENMLQGTSVFRGRDDNKYEMESHGEQGSIVSIPAKVLRGHTYLIRKIAEGKIKLLSAKEAAVRQDELLVREHDDIHTSTPLKYMEKGSQTANRYAVDNLPTEGEERGSQTAEQIWSGQAPPSAPKTVRRSGADNSANEPVVLPDVVVTDAVKEGEWTPDVG